MTSGKIFGIGLSKTGTSSLVSALRILGINAIHYPCDRATLQQLRGGNYQLSILEQCQAVAESIAPFYGQLDKCYPHSKFIMTVRDRAAWLESAKAHWQFVDEWSRRNADFRDFSEFICTATFGVSTFAESRFQFVYDLHTRNVREFFRSRPADLLVIDICGGEGWKKLCPFLQKAIPSVSFPFANRKQDKHEGQRWLDRFDRFLEKVRTMMQPNQKFLLVDDNQFCGTELYSELLATPFLERDGTYWGPPPDSSVAIDELEKHRARGVSAIIFGWPAFWWFDHYQEFAKSLRSGYQCIAEDELLRAFDLTKPAS